VPIRDILSAFLNYHFTLILSFEWDNLFPYSSIKDIYIKNILTVVVKFTWKGSQNEEIFRLQSLLTFTKIGLVFYQGRKMHNNFEKARLAWQIPELILSRERQAR
jgi:hypothetical protein